MKIGVLVAAASVCLSLAATVPAQADPIAYAVNEKGNWGWAYGYGSPAAAGDAAVGFCGGTGIGCKAVMAVEGDCLAFVEARSDSGGYWYWVGYTQAENAYNLSGEIKRVRDMVMGWCTSSDAPSGSCGITHSACLPYIRNLN